MICSRRSLIKNMSAAPLALGALGAMGPLLSGTAQARATQALSGVLTGNDPAGYLRFANWFGRKPTLAGLAFNQTSATALSSSISYICQQGTAFTRDGAKVLWSVPCPGPKQLEAIVAGSYDTLYTTLFKSILAASPNSSDTIFVRLPWEFNLHWQENAAIDKNGQFNATLFIKAWQRLATMCVGISPRFRRIWCPNVTTMSMDPATCWPGYPYVDGVAQDFYMQQQYNKPGDFSYFLNEQRGLLWGANFAKFYHKPYCLSEWGMDSDIFVGDLNATALWLSGLGTTLSHQCWWDRSDVIDCRISDGTHPGLAAAYKAQFF